MVLGAEMGWSLYQKSREVLNTHLIQANAKRERFLISPFPNFQFPRFLLDRPAAEEVGHDHMIHVKMQLKVDKR